MVTLVFLFIVSNHLQLQFYFFLYNLDSLYFFFFSDCCARISKTMLNKSDEKGYLCLFLDLRRNTFNFSLLSLMLNVGLTCAQSLSHVRFFSTSWTAACQAPLSLGILLVRMLGWVAISLFRDYLSYTAFFVLGHIPCMPTF